MRPTLPFSQIDKNDNDNITVLAPPRPWRQRRRFAAATLIAIVLNGSRPVTNDARIGGEGASWVCTPFVPLQAMICANDRRAGAPLSLAAAEALCSSSHHCYLLKCAATQQLICGGVKKQTIHCPGRHSDKEVNEKERSAFSFSSFGSSFDDEITESGRGAETTTVESQAVAVQTLNKTKMPAALRK